MPSCLFTYISTFVGEPPKTLYAQWTKYTNLIGIPMSANNTFTDLQLEKLLVYMECEKYNMYPKEINYAKYKIDHYNIYGKLPAIHISPTISLRDKIDLIVSRLECERAIRQELEKKLLIKANNKEANLLLLHTTIAFYYPKIEVFTLSNSVYINDVKYNFIVLKDIYDFLTKYFIDVRDFESREDLKDTPRATSRSIDQLIADDNDYEEIYQYIETEYKSNILKKADEIKGSTLFGYYGEYDDWLDDDSINDSINDNINDNTDGIAIGLDMYIRKPSKPYIPRYSILYSEHLKNVANAYKRKMESLLPFERVKLIY